MLSISLSLYIYIYISPPSPGAAGGRRTAASPPGGLRE